MALRRGRLVAVAAGGLGVATLVGAGFSLGWSPLEHWYIWKLTSGEDHEKYDAARKLGEVRSVRAIPILIRIIRVESPRSSNLSFVIFCSQTLVQIGSLALPPVLEACRAKDGGAVQLHHAMNDLKPAPEHVPCLIEALKDDRPGIRRIAIRCLVRLGPQAQDALPELLRAKNDEDLLVRWNASSLVKVLSRRRDGF